MSTFTNCPLAAILDAVVMGIWVIIMGLIFFTLGVSVVPGIHKKRMNFTVLTALGLFTTVIFILLMFFVPVLNFTGC